MQPHFEHVIGGCSRFEIKTHLLAPSLGRLEVEAEDTVLPLSVHPFLTCNLNMEGTQTLSARALLGLPLLGLPLLGLPLLGLPWALKPIFASLVHCSLLQDLSVSAALWC
ncbi:hypothetical protein PRNP1_006629 [Phytophthora ramorum]